MFEKNKKENLNIHNEKLKSLKNMQNFCGWFFTLYIKNMGNHSTKNFYQDVDLFTSGGDQFLVKDFFNDHVMDLNQLDLTNLYDQECLEIAFLNIVNKLALELISPIGNIYKFDFKDSKHINALLNALLKNLFHNTDNNKLLVMIFKELSVDIENHIKKQIVDLAKEAPEIHVQELVKKFEDLILDNFALYSADNAPNANYSL